MNSDSRALAWRRVSKRFGSVQALDELTLEVSRGEVFGFLGPNGAGKSTAIKIAVGLLRADRGEVRIGGFPAARAESRRLVGYLPEDPTFPRGFRLAEWLRYARQSSGPDPSDVSRHP